MTFVCAVDMRLRGAEVPSQRGRMISSAWRVFSRLKRVVFLDAPRSCNDLGGIEISLIDLQNFHDAIKTPDIESRTSPTNITKG